MAIEKRQGDSNFGLAFVILFGVLTVLGKSAYLYRIGASATEGFIGLLPAFACLLSLSWLYVALDRLHQHRWLRRVARAVIILTALAAALTTLIASGGFWKTGSIPRVQQLNGLTWDILAPSVREMLSKEIWILAIVLVSAMLILGSLRAVLRRLRLGHSRPALFGLLGVTSVILIAASISVGENGFAKHRNPIAIQLFRSDLDWTAASSEDAQLVATRFFSEYRVRLAQKNGAPRFPKIYSSLQASNVLWVVLESTRAKDVPLYGGSADMPNIMLAREHMLLLNNLYSQDPRSTKAYAQLDMGRFSLLSWDSYPNNLPWMFPEDGIASHLVKLGYQTAAMVNGDASYDHHKSFQEHHGYQTVLYRQALNPGSPAADDMRLLSRIGQELEQTHKPFYMMVWPIETHHPYGREFWANKGDWSGNHSENMKHRGAADHARYLQSLHEVDEWFGELIKTLKQKGQYENTVIVVTGDHGEAFGEHRPGNVFHGNGVYEESVHVTGFIYSPKIEGLHADNRYLRLTDVPATILHLASRNDYILNDGRSIFNDYTYAMPIYLFNSWGGAAGIIYDGYKLWHREKPKSPVYYASMSEIQRDPAKERQIAKSGQGKVLLGMLSDWETAMKVRTAQLLMVNDSSQPPLADVIRVYCDDGEGFRESLIFSTEFVGLSGSVTIPVNRDCRALRVAPIKRTEITPGDALDVSLESLQIVGHERIQDAKELKIERWSNLTVVDASHVSLTGDSAFFDYSLGSKPQYVRSVKMKIQFSWKRGSKTLKKSRIVQH